MTDWQGIYLDGNTPVRIPVTVTFNSNGLEIRDGKSLSMVWPFDQIHLTYKQDPGEPFRLKRNKQVSEALLISSPLFLKALHQFSPTQTVHLFRSGQRKLKLKIALSSLVGTVIFVPIFYFIFLPIAILTAAKFVPVSWEEQYGKSIVEGFAAPEDYCNDRRQMAVLDSVLKDLSDSIPNNPYNFQLKIVNDKIVNAFALPGGNIIVFSGLLEETDSPDEFAGVLAHEIQHIVRRHSTREILRQASTRFLVSALTGQFGNDSTLTLRGVRMLETLHYDRKLEEEADREGMKLLVSAKYQPEAMIRMFEKFEKGKSKRDPVLTFLSTHPATENRIENLKELMNKLTAQPIIHSQESLWKQARLICQGLS